MVEGRIVRIISNLFTVEVDNERIDCRARGKFRKDKLIPIVGDYVKINKEENVIEEILPRKNCLTRPVVANVDIALIVTSVKEPNLSLNLLDKLISIVTMNKIEPIICFTKVDLLNKKELKEIKQIAKYYEKIGIKVVTNKDKRKIKKYLKNKVGVLTGQTGAGKSTLLNKLDKSLDLETNPISQALNRGVHTTRHVELYKIGKTNILDTPGFSAIDFNSYSASDLANSFIEFKNYRCPFKDCTHDNEKKCLVKDAVSNGDILKSRYDNYKKFLGEIYVNNSKLYK